MPKVIDVFVHEGKMYKIMEKSPGQQCDKIPSDEIADIPQIHYDEFIENAYQVEQAGLQLDMKASNFFYDRETGFHFIDLGVL